MAKVTISPTLRDSNFMYGYYVVLHCDHLAGSKFVCEESLSYD